MGDRPFVFRATLKGHEWAEPVGIDIDAPPVETFLDMTPEKRAEMERLYGPLSSTLKKKVRVKEAAARAKEKRRRVREEKARAAAQARKGVRG